MSDFKAKMHQIRSLWGSLQRSLRPLAVFKGPTSKGREGKGGESCTPNWESGSASELQGHMQPLNTHYVQPAMSYLDFYQ